MRRACLASGLVLCISGCTPDLHLASGTVLTVDTVPITEVRATAPDGTILLGNAGLATRLSNGKVIIADGNRGDIALRVFDSAGNHLLDIGHKGQGPGEFEDISALAHCGGDSTFIFDYTLERVLVMGPAGALARTARTPPLTIVTCSPTGVILAASPALDPFLPTPQNAGRLYHMAVTLVHGADTVTLHDSLPAVDPRFGGRMPALAVAGSNAIIGLTDSAYATIFSPDGRRMREIRIADDPPPGSQRRFEKALDDFFTEHPGLASRKAMFVKLAYPDPAPSYSALFGAPDGTVWTQITSPGDSLTHLRATDSLGTAIGDVTLPFPLIIFEIGDDYILGRRENGIGEQRVVVYKMKRTGS